MMAPKIEMYDTGREIFSEGEPGKTIYVLLSGAVALKKNTAKGERVQKIVDTPNDFFGEMSLVEKKPRSFTAAAIKPSKVLCIGEADFERVIQTNGKFALKIVRILAERIQELNP